MSYLTHPLTPFFLSLILVVLFASLVFLMNGNSISKVDSFVQYVMDPLDREKLSFFIHGRLGRKSPDSRLESIRIDQSLEPVFRIDSMSWKVLFAHPPYSFLFLIEVGG